jgi:protein Tob/BTG
MKHEIQSAANFITHLLRLFGKKKPIPESQLKQFCNSLINSFRHRFQDHWFPEKPNKGSSYRTIRCLDLKIDPLLAQAGKINKLSEKLLLQTLPNYLTLWINPQEVTYRFGNGNICILYDNFDTEPWTHNTLINKIYKKNKIKKQQPKNNKQIYKKMTKIINQWNLNLKQFLNHKMFN